ncbi:MAG: hypothetical protein WD066_07885 [Planctomycetaceae bacterium]
MAARSQRKQELRKRQQQQKKAQKRKSREQIQRAAAPAVAGNSRHRQRVARQVPQAWDGERPEDVAVFDHAVLAALPAESAGQAVAVRDALRSASESRGDDALNRIAAIPRSSPLSEWRLFIRGLIAWLAGDREGTDDAWKRLDPQRRPGRIAAAMMTALRGDLERVSAGNGTPETSDEAADELTTRWLGRLDDQLLYHAKVLRRVRFDRAAIRVAEAGARLPDESRKLLLGPQKIDWLRNFAAEYRATEPELVAALERVALERAFVQSYSDLFDSAARTFVGPPHDRRNLLLTFFYYMKFANDPSAQKRADRSLEEYLTKDLPRNENLSEPLRQAIASQCHLNEAMELIQPAGGGAFGMMFGFAEDPNAIEKHLREAVRHYPANRRAYKAHVDWLESKLDDEWLTKPQRAPFVEKMADVMRIWSRGLPDDIEPRLWLVDHLLEDEQTEEVRPHVDWLAASRHDDPHVRAAPWKWQLLEAMRLCRRKAWLGQVPDRLDEADAVWPSWLSKQWLPYLKAAWTLRCGRTEEFDERRGQIAAASGIARDSLADACMMLGAAQRMRVPAADLKPLREPVEAALKRLRELPLEELLDASGFFWDLHRTRLLYPAYRMHGGKFAKETFDRLASRGKLVLDRIDDPRIHAAVLWNSEHRFWGDGYGFELPKWYSEPAIERHPMFAAARLNAFVKLRRHWTADRHAHLGPLLREAAPSQRDPFYRHWFASLPDELDETLAKNASRFAGSMFGTFSRMFGDDDDDDDDDDSVDLGFDPNCNCPECRAAKRKYEASR